MSYDWTGERTRRRQRIKRALVALSVAFAAGIAWMLDVRSLH
ncbi:hypothetical protein [Arvimicrobium flavum]|nr:hypothetical protein [Mesorhizobium shangrilense]